LKRTSLWIRAKHFKLRSEWELTPVQKHMEGVGEISCRSTAQVTRTMPEFILPEVADWKHVMYRSKIREMRCFIIFN
jgi:hypothetical protein